MCLNTWNTYGHDINEELIIENADKMVELGIRVQGMKM